MMNIVIAPDSFKEALPAEEVCAAIARGVRRVYPEALIDAIPMADGGEGTVDALIAATGGHRMQSTVTGPLGGQVVARWGILGTAKRVAVMEMASASGLALVSPDQRDPLKTSTTGTGELILTAMDRDVSDILIGIGGSATNDGGAGAAQVLGVRFLDGGGNVLPAGLAGGDLDRITRIDVRQRDPRLARTTIRVACDVDNPLCGPRGAAAIYAPQKGAGPEQVHILDRNLGHLADCIERDLCRLVRAIPGAGAAGGLGAGMIAFFDATLQPGVQMVMEAVGFSRRIADADLVITGEGRIDEQSMMGKVIEGVGRAARSAGVPVIAFAGCVGAGAEATLEVLDRYHCITPAGMALPEALANTARHLEHAVAAVLREQRR